MKGLIHNRDSFLAAVAERHGRTPNTKAVARPKWSWQPQDAVLKEADADELLEALKTQCMVIHTDLVVTNKNKLQETLKEIVANYGGGPVIAWKDERFHEYGVSSLLEDVWPSEGVPVHIWDSEIGAENIHFAEKANVGLTISDITLAESGTAVLFSSKDKGRTVSFLPTCSVILIPKSSLVPRMTQAARKMREKVANGELIPSCVNFITGPSNSADIEMNLVVGVHGPVKAAYIVIEDL
ncbi:lactate utilization protein C [Bacillus sp. V3-13]|uniref:LutC/YkgG family protein n=1 Tax=Bacillus sp. V3-13 TaxID=2053728 RepID=UPI000C77989A|nr:lactate utilization protein C [Bacillus sp. V3-13]PLR76106.1 lactate utilization protein C [Bacillus sp. V3-13]